ncbi:hypothetical protein [Sediminibacterium sp.]|uniref:hypothetical protein n=1 Tax=Sediminibacterium sp. TaxID=1917865 RepID=UPI0027351F37|nr:hypothetical protein [Sediminibacterium sp.]MDP3392958.1 hypothetical protein [Sediminibacterium sp.]MDP3567164.1 hypothetical protein [Sediminibacterium sp.]
MRIIQLLLFSIYLLLIHTTQIGFAQQYHAIHGSSYAGVSGAFNNPASIGNSLHRWDFQLFSGQTSIYTNTVLAQALKNAAINRSGDYLTDGFQIRNLNTNSDLSLFSAMYRINKKHAVAIAFRGKMYNHIYTNNFNLQDTATSLRSFFKINRTTPFLDSKSIHAGWGEVNLTYAGALLETDNSRLTVGATLQFSKSLFGAFSQMNKARFRENINGTDTSYTSTSGVGEYGYSANYDVIQQFGATSATIKSFFNDAKSGMGLSVGIEYLNYNNETYLDNRNYEGRIYNYKIGFSIVDIGAQKFNNSEYTGRFSENNNGISDAAIARAFNGVNNTRDLRDSLGVIYDSIQVLPAQFSIGNPTRAILNFDKQINPTFFVNTQMVIHFSNAKNALKQKSNDYSFLTITPRWETLNWGIYMPIQYTRDGQIWTGLAIKAGPFIAGIHRLGILKQGSLLNGGGYILLNIHPFRKKEMKSRIDCFD